MKKVLLLTCLVGSLGFAQAQDENEYSDEELKSYANVMVWAELEKDKMTDIYNDWIKNDEVLSVPRFKEIDNVKADSIKLLDMNVSVDEKAAYDQIMINYDSMIASFKEVYIGKIKDDIGAGLYNTLKKDVKKNEEVKTRYNAIFEELKNDALSEEDESED